MISFKTFERCINHLKRKEDFNQKLNDLLGEYDDVYCCFEPDPSLTDSFLINVLEEGLGLPSSDVVESDLSWWIYDMCYGKKYVQGESYEDVNLPEDHPYRCPDLSTLEKVYEWLFWLGENNLNEK